jgi:serine/threonine protein phosphatase PrpC
MRSCIHGSRRKQQMVCLVEDSFAQSVCNWLLRPIPSLGIRGFPDIGAALATTRGQVRTQNQDRAIVATFETGMAREAFQLFVVCDGVGGMQDGARCASLAIANFASDLIATRAVYSGEQRLKSAIKFANKQVLDAYHEHGGTTIAAVLLSSSGPVACSVGDTRIYLTDSKAELKQLTVDDTLAGRVAALTDASSVANGIFGNRLAQYVGQSAELAPQVINLASAFDLSGNVREAGTHGILIVTDGVHCLPKVVIEGFAKSTTSPRDLVSRLIYASDWIGGPDNASALYIATSARLQSSQFSSKFARLRIQDSFSDVEFMIPASELPRQMPLTAVRVQTQDSMYSGIERQRKAETRVRRKPKPSRKKKSGQDAGQQPELQIEVTPVGNYRK